MNKIDLTIIPDDAIDEDSLWKLWTKPVTDVLISGNQENLELFNIKCECGAHKTYGEDCMSSMHSDWCILYKDRI